MELLPITLLSGLQGAGLLANALTAEHGGGKMFAVVETLGQLEALAAHPKCKQATRTSPSRLDFPNGCMCVALAPQDLLTNVAELAQSGSYSACIIADPGTAEPIKIASALTFAPLSLAEDVEKAGQQQQEQGGCQHHGHHQHHHHEHQHKKACCEKGGEGSCCPAPQQEKGAAQPECEKKQGKAVCHAGCCDEADEGPTLMSVCRLDTCVTVLDASTFKADLQSIEEMADRVPGGDQRNVATLLVEMVEFANVVVINKSDLVKKNDLAEVHELVAALNPCARIVEAQHSSVPVQDIMRTNMFDLEKTSRSAGWLKALEDMHTKPSTKQESKKGVATYIYTARRPMHPGRLYRNFMRKFFLTRVIASDSDESGSESGEEPEEGSDDEMQEQQEQQEQWQQQQPKQQQQQQQQQQQTQQGKAGDSGKGGKKSVEHQHAEGSSESSDEEEEDEEMQEALADYAAARDEVLKATKKELGEVVRSKGFFWLATQDESILGWDNVGALLQVMKEGCWFACVPKEEWPQEEEILKRIHADFSPERPEVGDRRQELVFIGKNLKEDAIRELLDSCLATEEEVAAAKEGKLRDELFGGEDEEGSDGSASEEEVSLEEAQEILKQHSKAARSGKRART